MINHKSQVLHSQVKGSGTTGQQNDNSLHVTVTTLDTTRPSVLQNFVGTGKTDYTISISSSSSV